MLCLRHVRDARTQAVRPPDMVRLRNLNFMDASAPQTTPPAVQEISASEIPSEDSLQLGSTVKNILVGKPLDLADRSIYQHVSLIAFLAWVGLGADGLSSSCYGPSEANAVIGQFDALSIPDKQAILDFLRSL